MKKIIVSSALLLSMTAFMINFCACGNKAQQPASAEEQQIQPHVESRSENRSVQTDGKVVTLAQEGDFNALIAQGNVVVDFFAEWCGPCKALGPVLEQLAQSNTHITFVKVNVDSFNLLSSRYNVKGLPTLIFFKNGQKVSTVVGGKSKNDLQSLLKHMRD
jgi:thioredoxin 1